MQLPKMAPREIPAALRFQAEKEIMIPIDEAVIDLYRTGRAPYRWKGDTGAGRGGRA